MTTKLAQQITSSK